MIKGLSDGNPPNKPVQMTKSCRQVVAAVSDKISDIVLSPTWKEGDDVPTGCILAILADAIWAEFPAPLFTLTRSVANTVTKDNLVPESFRKSGIQIKTLQHLIEHRAAVAVYALQKMAPLLTTTASRGCHITTMGSALAAEDTFPSLVELDTVLVDRDRWREAWHNLGKKFQEISGLTGSQVKELLQKIAMELKVSTSTNVKLNNGGSPATAAQAAVRSGTAAGAAEGGGSGGEDLSLALPLSELYRFPANLALAAPSGLPDELTIFTVPAKALSMPLLISLCRCIEQHLHGLEFGDKFAWGSHVYVDVCQEPHKVLANGKDLKGIRLRFAGEVSLKKGKDAHPLVLVKTGGGDDINIPIYVNGDHMKNFSLSKSAEVPVRAWLVKSTNDSDKANVELVREVSEFDLTTDVINMMKLAKTTTAWGEESEGDDDLGDAEQSAAAKGLLEEDLDEIPTKCSVLVPALRCETVLPKGTELLMPYVKPPKKRAGNKVLVSAQQQDTAATILTFVGTVAKQHRAVDDDGVLKIKTSEGGGLKKRKNFGELDVSHLLS